MKKIATLLVLLFLCGTSLCFSDEKEMNYRLTITLRHVSASEAAQIYDKARAALEGQHVEVIVEEIEVPSDDEIGPGLVIYSNLNE